MNVVFVYGTLRKNEENHHFLNNSTRIAEQAWTKGTLYDTGLGYPAMAETPENRVYGEVYHVSDDDLKKLDWLEDFEEGRDNNLYERIEQTVYTDSKELKAMTYIAKELNMCKEEIRYGDWKVYLFLKEKPTPFYYFAYGSCMDNERFHLANVHHLFENKLGAAILKNHEMRYTIKIHDGGRADIIETNGINAEGILYQCPFETVDYLFHREGVEAQLYRPAIVEVEYRGQQLKQVLTFIVVSKQKEEAPPVHYATEIIRGAKDYVSKEYLEKLQKQLADLGVKI